MALFPFSKKKKPQKDNSQDKNEESEKKKGSFSFTKKEQPSPEPQQSPVMSKLLDINRKIRITEERYSNIQKQIQFDESALLDTKKEFSETTRDLDRQISELALEIEKLRDQLTTLQSEIKNTATKHEVHEVKKYAELWEPLEFITAKQAEKIMKRIIEEHKIQNQHNSNKNRSNKNRSNKNRSSKNSNNNK